MTKKVVSAALAVVMCMGLAACTPKESETTISNGTEQNELVEDTLEVPSDIAGEETGEAGTSDEISDEEAGTSEDDKTAESNDPISAEDEMTEEDKLFQSAIDYAVKTTEEGTKCKTYFVDFFDSENGDIIVKVGYFDEKAEIETVHLAAYTLRMEDNNWTVVDMTTRGTYTADDATFSINSDNQLFITEKNTSSNAAGGQEVSGSAGSTTGTSAADTTTTND